MSDLRVYTDGACSQNTGAGGWACIIDNGHRSIEYYGPSKAPTTNNRMELAAILRALQEIPSGTPITVYTDSAYAKGALTAWWRNWVHQKWTTKDGQPVKNRDVIERALNEMARIGQVQIVHVMRNSSPAMIRADELAKEGKKQFQFKKEAVTA